MSLFQLVGAWLWMSVVWLIGVLFVVFLCSGFRTPLSPLLCFITVFLNICILLWCFTDEVEDLYADCTYICNLESHVGIKHGFSCINIRQVPWEVLKTEAEGRGFQHLPRDLANVNALKKTCSIAIIAYKLKTFATFCVISCTILFHLFTDVSRRKFPRTMLVLGPGSTRLVTASNLGPGTSILKIA